MAQNNKLLVLHSGGIDSLALLYRVLNEYDFNVTAVYIHFNHYGNNIRQSSESRLAKAQCEWLNKNVRKFKSIEYIASPNYQQNLLDSFVLLETAGKLYTQNNYFGISSGVCAEDIDDTDWSPGYSLFEKHAKVKYLNVRWRLPNHLDSKKDKYNSLPIELRKIINWCRNPINNRPCGQCRTCLHYKNAEIFYE